MGVVMGIGVNHQGNSHLSGPVGVSVPKVQAFGRGVNLQGGAGITGGLQHGFQVELNWFPLAQQPSGQMPDDGHGWMFNRLNHAGGHGGLVLTHGRVDRCDDHVQLSQHLVRKVHLTTGANVTF